MAWQVIGLGSPEGGGRGEGNSGEEEPQVHLLIKWLLPKAWETRAAKAQGAADLKGDKTPF